MMANNQTANNVELAPTDDNDSKKAEYLVGFLVYVFVGLAVFSLNMPIFLAVAIYEKLRAHKEYVVVAALALADAMDGALMVLAGALRSRMIVRGEGMGIFIFVSKFLSKKKSTLRRLFSREIA